MHLICVGCDHFWFLSISGLFLFPSLSLPVSVLLISFYFVSTIHSQMLRSCCSMFCLSFTYIRDIRNACVSEMLPILLFSFIYWDVFLPGTPYNNGRCCRSYFYQWLKLNCTKRASIRVCVCVCLHMWCTTRISLCFIETEGTAALQLRRNNNTNAIRERNKRN